jgi:hypothetical protein
VAAPASAIVALTSDHASLVLGAGTSVDNRPAARELLRAPS